MGWLNNEFEKVKNRLPVRHRLVFGPYTLIPVTDYAGFVVPDTWCVPGETGANNRRAHASTDELRRRAKRIGMQVRVLI